MNELNRRTEGSQPYRAVLVVRKFGLGPLWALFVQTSNRTRGSVWTFWLDRTGNRTNGLERFEPGLKPISKIPFTVIIFRQTELKTGFGPSLDRI